MQHESEIPQTKAESPPSGGGAVKKRLLTQLLQLESELTASVESYRPFW